MQYQSNAAMLRRALLAATMLVAVSAPAFADIDDGRMDNETTSPPLPSGQHIAPLAATGAYFTKLNPGLKAYPNYTVGQAIKTAVSHDGKTLLVMTSGFNNLNDSTGNFDPAGSNEYVFVFDISGANSIKPKQVQVIEVPDTYVGLIFSHDDKTFYASGGIEDVVYQYGYAGGAWAKTGTVKLGHATGNGLLGFQGPSPANLALSLDGKKLIVANFYNDSVSVVDTATLAVTGELDLRPGLINPAETGQAGGEYPFGVAIKGNSTVYVSSIRDREIDVVDVINAKPTLAERIHLAGSPNSVLLSPDLTRLYVAEDNTDTVAVIETRTNRLIEEIRTAAPEGLLSNPEHFTGAAPNALALSPDEKTLYVSNGGANSVAVINLAGAAPHHTVGLIPTGWYPHSVSVSHDGRALYVVNGKSDPGPNPANLFGSTGRLKDNGKTPAQNAADAAAANAANQYVFQLEKAGLLALPVPGAAELDNLTHTVAANNGYSLTPNEHDEAVMGALHARIQHVIYIVKENRTFDQVLGDLHNNSNGDPALAVFGQTITPNFHRLATNFVTLDNFFDSGEVSGNGWPWTTSARETDNIVKAIPLDYASSPLGNPYGRGAPYDAEGQNRSVDTGYATVAERQKVEPRYPNDPNLLPGHNNIGAPDGPNGQRQRGYIWDSALRAGLTVRNYGFFCDLDRYNSGDFAAIPDDLMPALNNPPVQVAFPTNPTLIPLTDLYFRGFDNAFPDVFREQEWAREFDQYVTNKNLPSLSLVRLMHDHMGSFGAAILGVNFPEAQQADNDYAVGLLIDRVAHSPYKDNTLIFVIEDDAQDGPDHVDAHRSTGYVVGPYVKQHAVVSVRYSTVNMLRTIEDVLGMDHLNLNDAYQRPMTDVFDLNQKHWTFHAQGSTILNQTLVARELPIDYANAIPLHFAHPASYWAEATRGFDWTKEDRVPAVLFNQIVWKGLTDKPYPTVRDGADLRQDRERLIAERGLHIGE